LEEGGGEVHSEWKKGGKAIRRGRRERRGGVYVIKSGNGGGGSGGGIGLMFVL
jgi:hypothetical protein